MNPKVTDTSMHAFTELKESGKLNKKQEAVLKFFIRQHRTVTIIRSDKSFEPTENFTYHEVELFGNIRNAQKRLNELEKKGFIKKVGRRSGCATYQYVADPVEQESLRQYHQRKKPELEQFLDWMEEHKARRCPAGWQVKIDNKHPVFNNKQLIKQFRQAKKLIESQQLIF